MTQNKDITPPYVIRWLKTCLLLVLFMVAVGGLTRLTESGLSIVEWKLISGVFPPLTQAGWESTFADYQATPEYIHKNMTMDVSEFKGIYWLEYLHRLLGRLIGLAVLLPLVYITLKKAVAPPALRKLWGILALICTQGAVGWYMVKSGLVTDPWVSPYRLAFHLSLATVILGSLYWMLRSLTVSVSVRRRFTGIYVLVFIAIQIIWGAFVAGLDAGMIYNEFPRMGGVFMPDELFSLSPWISNLFDHHATVQFIHRWFAFIVLTVILFQWVRYRNHESFMVLTVAAIQVILGISTLISMVDITLASIHQLTAMVLVLAQLRFMFNARITGFVAKAKTDHV